MEEGSKEDKRIRKRGRVMAICRYCLNVVSSEKCSCTKCSEGKVVAKVIDLKKYIKINKK